jgi:predicted metal-dependent HD superfamily phosphohydrolase
MRDEDGFDELLALLPVPPAARDDLRARLAEPSRRYHGTAHVALLWRRHRDFGAGLRVTAPPWHLRIACAIAFHDAIYDATRADNETRSAALWRAAAPAMDAAGVDWVAGTIEATADHLGAAPPPGMDDTSWQARAWMLDLDLTPIGESPAVFDANTALLREEYAHVADADWQRGRAAFLGRLAAAPALYRSPALRAAFEDPARRNLARDLARL